MEVRREDRVHSLSFDEGRHGRLYISKLGLLAFLNTVYDGLPDMDSYKFDMFYYLVPKLYVY